MRPLYLTAMAFALAAPVAPRLAAAPGPVSHCQAGETMVYSCGFGRSIGSVCVSPGSVHYRFGPPGKPALEIASDRDWSNIHRGGVIGGGGGSEVHLRFTRRDHDYVVFWGEAGQYTDVPGKRWSGIHVARGDTQLAVLNCKAATQPVDDWEGLLTRNLPKHLSAVPEDSDPRFDMWF